MGLTIARIVLSLLLLAHLNACLFAFVAAEASAHDSWLHRLGNGDKDIKTKYLLSLYWSFSIICSGEGGGIVPSNDSEAL